MKFQKYLIHTIYLIWFIIYPTLISAQSRSWTKELSDDSKTEVAYAVYDSVNAEGEDVKFIEYSTSTTTNASIENCAAVFNNPDMHKEFYEYTEVSEKIKDVSENEWIVYYYYSPPWPIADNDCASRIKMKRDSVNNKIVFSSFSEPNLIEMKDVTRSELNNVTFTFAKINDSEVAIIIEAKLIPAVSAPKWMMKGWFPDGPANTLKRFKELAENL